MKRFITYFFGSIGVVIGAFFVVFSPPIIGSLIMRHFISNPNVADPVGAYIGLLLEIGVICGIIGMSYESKNKNR